MVFSIAAAVASGTRIAMACLQRGVLDFGVICCIRYVYIWVFHYAA